MGIQEELEVGGCGWRVVQSDWMRPAKTMRTDVEALL